MRDLEEPVVVDVGEFKFVVALLRRFGRSKPGRSAKRWNARLHARELQIFAQTTPVRKQPRHVVGHERARDRACDVALPLVAPLQYPAPPKCGLGVRRWERVEKLLLGLSTPVEAPLQVKLVDELKLTDQEDAVESQSCWPAVKLNQLDTEASGCVSRAKTTRERDSVRRARASKEKTRRAHGTHADRVCYLSSWGPLSQLGKCDILANPFEAKNVDKMGG